MKRENGLRRHGVTLFSNDSGFASPSTFLVLDQICFAEPLYIMRSGDDGR